MNFGERLKYLRERDNKTQKEFAKIFNMSHANISRYESGTQEPTLSMLNLFSEYFEVTIDYLLGKTDDPHGDSNAINPKLMQRIKDLREKHNLTQIQLAAMLGLSRPTIAMYESGKVNPQLTIITKLSEYFGVTTDYLLGLVEDPGEQKTKLVPSSDFPNNEEWNEMKKYTEYISVLKELDIEKISPDELKKWLEAIKKLKDI